MTASFENFKEFLRRASASAKTKAAVFGAPRRSPVIKQREPALPPEPIRQVLHEAFAHYAKIRLKFSMKACTNPPRVAPQAEEFPEFETKIFFKAFGFDSEAAHEVRFLWNENALECAARATQSNIRFCGPSGAGEQIQRLKRRIL